jgi:hypothetical protein
LFYIKASQDPLLHRFMLANPEPSRVSMSPRLTGTRVDHEQGLQGSYQCFLFAQGSGSMQLNYHGAARGTSCYYYT